MPVPSKSYCASRGMLFEFQACRSSCVSTILSNSTPVSVGAKAISARSFCINSRNRANT